MGPKNLQIHHIIPKRDGGENIPENMITVCKKCHGKIHSKMMKPPCPQPRYMVKKLRKLAFQNMMQNVFY